MKRERRASPSAGDWTSQNCGERKTVPLVCSCGCTFAQVREDGALIIVSRHHGQKCVNVLTMDDLEELCLRDKARD